MASLRRFLHRDAPPASWQSSGDFASPPSHAHRERAETAPTSHLEPHEASAIPVPTSVSSFSHFFDRAGGRSSSSSSSSDGDDLDGGGVMTSTSYFRPRTMDGYSRYLE
ncbi:hypothetical protein PHMEG_0009641 [Phytophthora megakarya]|uniref:Uncharacterized protein n=1 Tax=Phytophthora megakarya TaxID=4795 RepID=A0A225WFP7_9STRA|nr:hypothetical protein PHMEG_0009641 [Phytophthora megakarya]